MSSFQHLFLHRLVNYGNIRDESFTVIAKSNIFLKKRITLELKLLIETIRERVKRK